MVGGFGVAIGGVDVAGASHEGLVSEEDLDSGGVRAWFSEVGGKAVTQFIFYFLSTNRISISFHFNN